MSRSPTLALSRTVHTDGVVVNSQGSDAPNAEQPPLHPLICASRRAVGFNSSTSPKNVVKALQIEAHLADAPALSFLNIRGGEGVGRISLLAVDKQLILLQSTLADPSRLRIYIIHDAVARSISIIPSHPWSQPCQPLSTDWGQRPKALASRILVARPSDYRQGYALVSMAEMGNYKSGAGAVHSKDVLYLWRSSSPQWDLITARFPPKFKGDHVNHSYNAVLAFSLGSRAFWANLVRGVMHCSTEALFSGPSSGGPRLKFDFINLPVELEGRPQLPSHVQCAMELNSNMYRTMGQVRETSIKFVTIDGFMEFTDFIHCTLTVWSLSQDMTGWTKNSSLCLGRLAEQEEFKNAGMSTDLVPMYPSLSKEEDDVIYFMLGVYEPCCFKHEGSKDKCKDYIAVAGKALHLLRVDICRGVLLDSVSLPDQVGVDFTFCDLGRHLCATSHDS